MAAVSCLQVSFTSDRPHDLPPSRLTFLLPPSLPIPHAQQPPGVVPAISETILGGAAVLAQAAGNSLDNACRVANAEELDDAITTKTCPVVILTSSERMAYVLTHEIVISRPVTVMGNSFLLPFIDCSDVVRGFRVVPGGYLDLQFVRINIGLGVARPRWGLFRKQKTRRNLQGDEILLDEEVSREGRTGDIEDAMCFRVSFPSLKH